MYIAVVSVQLDNEDTSWLLLINLMVAILVEAWKLTKAWKSEANAASSKTAEYDRAGFR